MFPDQIERGECEVCRFIIAKCRRLQFCQNENGTLTVLLKQTALKQNTNNFKMLYHNLIQPVQQRSTCIQYLLDVVKPHLNSV